MSLCSLYTWLLCIILVNAVTEYHLLSAFYVSRTLQCTMHTYHSMQPLLLRFSFEDLDTKDSMSMII